VAHKPARVKRLSKTYSTKLLSKSGLLSKSEPLPKSAARLPLTFALALTLALCANAPRDAHAKAKRRVIVGASAAVVVDERLSALRDAPELSANVLRRIGRGRYVSVTGERRTREGLTFLRVSVTSRTAGWIQSEALARPSRAGEDARLLRLIKGSEEFDRVERARIFLEAFPRSTLRPAALLLLGDAARASAERLTREALRRLDAREMEAGGAPLSSYYRNYSGLDRYRRQGVVFDFDAGAKRFRYDGAAFREILRRHPRSPEASEARARLQAPAAAP